MTRVRNRLQGDDNIALADAGPASSPAAVHGSVSRPWSIHRSALIERLLIDDSFPIVSVVAPPGYGKTTLLSQWAERDRRALAWVPVEDRDNDPKVLLRRVAAALDAIAPMERRVFDALEAPGGSASASVIPRLAAAFSSMSTAVLLVLDDVHVLRQWECRAALSALAEVVPEGSRLALAGRTDLPLRLKRLRAEGRILELGPSELMLTHAEAALLFQNAGAALGEDEVAELHRRTEGWPVGLYLAALCIREGGPLGDAALSCSGADQFVGEYVESELLSRISRRDREFLTRTAVLDRMCGSLCDAVLETHGSVSTLTDLARSNLLLVPLDRRGKWYRYHHLFRDLLLAELDRGEPESIPNLRRRAATWCLRNDLPEAALEYNLAANEVDAVAALVGELSLATYQQGRIATMLRWYRWLQNRHGIERHPRVAAMATVLYALTGHPFEAEHWADSLDLWPGGFPAHDDPAGAWAALARAAVCRRGIEQMAIDADDAVNRFAALHVMAPMALVCQGLARVLAGDPDAGDASFQDATIMASAVGAPEGLAEALSLRSLLAMERRDWAHAEIFAEQAATALHRAGIDNYVGTLGCAARARIATHHRDAATARREIVATQRGRPSLTYALPHMAVLVRLELIRTHLALADLAGARTIMDEVDEVLRRRPDLGILVDAAQALRIRLAHERGSITVGASALTGAELRLLPMLATHLSVPEIAAEMFLSRNTVRSQAMSLYRKLGASSRSQAVTRSRELGLLET